MLNAVLAMNESAISGHASPFIERFENEFANFCGTRYAVACSSGTAALHLAARALPIRPGDEVLVSALTNIATANAVIECGGIVVPVDSEPETWNLNPHLLDSLVSRSTTAIFPVHIYGHPADMPRIASYADSLGLSVIEDAAEAHGAEIQGKRVGSFGDAACFSFYANKVITTGEGGMIVTDSLEIAAKASSLRNLAFGTPRFLHYEVGYNYRMSNLSAAIGCGQMTRIDEIIQAKRDLARRYTERLTGTPGLQLPIEKDGYRNIYWMYSIVVNEKEYGESRDTLQSRLARAGIDTRTMFAPLNIQPALLLRGAVKPTPCPVAERLWREGMYLPSTPTLTDSELDYICSTIRNGR